ncbi:hypothetical protein AB4144_45515, partial [Rhizobiaceae sp. 2RAB30]
MSGANGQEAVLGDIAAQFAGERAWVDSVLRGFRHLALQGKGRLGLLRAETRSRLDLSGFDPAHDLGDRRARITDK